MLTLNYLKVQLSNFVATQAGATYNTAASYLLPLFDARHVQITPAGFSVYSVSNGGFQFVRC